MADDYDRDRQRVVDALCRMLRWNPVDAVKFVRKWTIGEVDDAAEHLQLVRDARVGLATVVYIVRMRLAGDDVTRQRSAAKEAHDHARLFPEPYSTAHGQASDADPPRTYTDPTDFLDDE